jgi:hypothetical protein
MAFMPHTNSTEPGRFDPKPDGVIVSAIDTATRANAGRTPA